MASTKDRKSILTPLHPFFAVLNWAAFAGWSYVLLQLAYISLAQDSDADELESLGRPVLGLEVICLIEVVRIVMGDLPGNMVLGVVLHAIRFTVLTLVWKATHWTGPAIYWSWAVTEVSRYPMYMFPNQPSLRSIRMVVPLVTFPVGAFAEAYATYLAFINEDDATSKELWQQGLFVAVLFVNGVLGPTMAYPALLKKGLPVLGFAKKGGDKKNSAKAN